MFDEMFDFPVPPRNEWMEAIFYIDAPDGGRGSGGGW